MSGASRWALLLALSAATAVACSSDDEPKKNVKRSDAAPSVGLDAACVEEQESSVDGLPKRLSCAGLYSDIASKEVAADLREYSPAVPLWSDGAEKRRWISLPPDTQIDVSAPADWVFPVGTSFFKEFSVDGRRIETRLFRKTRDNRWDRTTYEWAEDESDATRSEGRDVETVQLNGSTYRIPSGRECNQCHEGRRDRILGFEAVSLGLPGATGISLAQLAEEGLLTPTPERVELEIGDDGTGAVAGVMGWMHVNCGVSCHNDNGDSEAYSTRLRLQLDPEQLDGRSSSEFAIRATTIDERGKTLRWQDDVRIVPGEPEQSLLFKLVGSRAGKNDQMPPIASRVVDTERLEALRTWILALGESNEASPPDSEPPQSPRADSADEMDAGSPPEPSEAADEGETDREASPEESAPEEDPEDSEDSEDDDERADNERQVDGERSEADEDCDAG